MTANRYVPTAADGSYTALFKAMAAELDASNEQRERIVKASRDTTIQSKKAIFDLHRLTSANREAVLDRVTASMGSIRDLIATRIAKELCADTYAQFHRAFSPGLQEYVEAALFLAYAQTGALRPHAELERELADACASANIAFAMRVEHSDYVLGVADFTGELMRLAVGAAAHGDMQTPFHVREFLTPLYVCFETLGRGVVGRDFGQKLRTFRQSLAKVEAACFDITMRRAEFGDAALPSLRAVGGGERGDGRAPRAVGCKIRERGFDAEKESSDGMARTEKRTKL